MLGEDLSVAQRANVRVREILRNLRSSGTHPLGFWRRMGYTVVGVVPDAEGLGKPTILLAKRIE